MIKNINYPIFFSLEFRAKLFGQEFWVSDNQIKFNIVLVQRTSGQENFSLPLGLNCCLRYPFILALEPCWGGGGGHLLLWLG